MSVVPSQASRIEQLVIQELTQHEMRLLTLTVAVRRAMVQSPTFKGDLSESVRSSVQRLVALKQVRDQDGVFSLLTNKQPN